MVRSDLVANPASKNNGAAAPDDPGIPGLRIAGGMDHVLEVGLNG